MAKRKTLPKDFEVLLKSSDLDALIRVFDTCDVNAVGGYHKRPAIAFATCPRELAVWLVDQGADVNLTDAYGYTPLQAHAQHFAGQIALLVDLGTKVNDGAGSLNGTALHAAGQAHVARNIEALLQVGADVHAANRFGETALDVALKSCSNATLSDMAQIATALLGAGASVSPDHKGHVERIGKEFEFHRSNFHPDDLSEWEASLATLYQLFDVQPVAARAEHDGTSRIEVPQGSPLEVFDALWDLLVPGSGAALSLQGEVIRVAGRLSHELDGNGGINWDDDFAAMAEAWLGFVQQGQPLGPALMGEAQALIARAKERRGNMAGLHRLAVMWVACNPQPFPLPPQSYSR